MDPLPVKCFDLFQCLFCFLGSCLEDTLQGRDRALAATDDQSKTNLLIAKEPRAGAGLCVRGQFPQVHFCLTSLHLPQLKPPPPPTSRIVWTSLDIAVGPHTGFPSLLGIAANFHFLFPSAITYLKNRENSCHSVLSKTEI